MIKFIVNNLLLITGIITVISGLTLQLGYHMGHDPHPVSTVSVVDAPARYEQMRDIDTEKTICGFDYYSWSAIHKYTIIILTLVTIYHFCLHWKWYKGVIKKKMIRKNQQVLILTLLFIIVAVTGLVPWFADLAGSAGDIRMGFIEIHDKVTFVLIIYMVLHVIKRLKWFKLKW